MHTRDSSMDAARGILMMLGIVLHIAQIFTIGDTGFMIKTPGGDMFFNWLVGLIHEFRMPAFFLIAGFFTALSIEKYSLQEYFSKRVVRLMVPLIMVWITLNPIQDYLVFGIAFPPGQNHLWFLIDLLIISMFAAFIPPDKLKKVSEFLPKNSIFLIIVITLLSYIFSVGLRSTGMSYDVILGITTLFRLSSSIPFVLFGMMLYSNTSLRESFYKVPVWLLPFVLPVAYLLREYTQHQSFVIMELAFISELFLIWISVSCVLQLFRIIFKTETKTTKFLADSAYTIFLFHMVFVVAFGLWWSSLAIPVVLQFILMNILVFGVTAAIHIYGIRKYAVLGFLFNGK